MITPENPLNPCDPSKKIYLYAVYKAWKDNPKNVAVEEYFDTEKEARDFVRTQKKDSRFDWGVGGFQ